VPYQANTRSVVISFAAGVYMPHLPGDAILDTLKMLPSVDNEHFKIAGQVFTFPTFETAEDLVSQMIGCGILAHDEIVTQTLKGKPKAISRRDAQRHFARTTGTTLKQLQQIERAQQAVRMLQKGKKPIEVAQDTGYADQPHLAKSLKRLMNARPSDVDDIHKV